LMLLQLLHALTNAPEKVIITKHLYFNFERPT
jgi:hypothetical protein